KDIRDEYNYPKKKGIKDECSRLLEASTMKSRRGFAIQRLMNAMRQAHADGWFIVFDTLIQRRAPLRLPLVPRNGCGRPGRAPERFLPLDITSLLLHVIFDARFLLRQ